MLALNMLSHMWAGVREFVKVDCPCSLLEMCKILNSRSDLLATTFAQLQRSQDVVKILKNSVGSQLRLRSTQQLQGRLMQLRSRPIWLATTNVAQTFTVSPAKDTPNY